MSEDERDPNLSILEQHVNQLAEHFDNVQILVSSVTDEGDSTTNYVLGCGNWNARVHQARVFVMRDEAEIHARVQRDVDEE